ncbi:MAG: bifunctional folylpolyglutamate synthase/dihydrofolate synthase [Akkermansiaceae bacterium]|nr:bifunctional folylpolyglutamate synthase/dihydrofolate synthase [Akkermansiaceae bacterium]MCP5549942.1 bifunctional folylpolyglutamate synthase/dihydrofolate synthase [Akkermansiaceae bacterium]
MTYPEAIEWLYGTQLFGIKLGLENSHRLLQELEAEKPSPATRIVHVAGTNGKGSVCAMLDAMLRAGGARTGLFTSPHLVSFRERIRVNGGTIAEDEVASGLSEIRARVEAWEIHPTFFEITLGLAMRHFKRERCQALVIETGMGGRLDATNALASDVAVITPIGLDHTQWLGKTHTAVAVEKAGIIKPGKPVVSALQVPEAAAVIEVAARREGAPLHLAGRTLPENWTVALTGPHQRQNAALAVAAARLLWPEISESAIETGLATVKWPARFQRIGERFVIDGAHNAHAAAVLAETWRATFPAGEKATVIFGGVATKDTSEVLSLLGDFAGRWIFVKVASQRGLPAENLLKTWNSLSRPGIPAETAPSMTEALARAEAVAEADPILVTGSLYLAGEAIAQLQGGPPFEPSEQ